MPPRFSAFLRSDNTLGSLLVLVALAVYWTTLAPSIGFIDAGELAAVAHTFGIAHPTGYPLFTLAAGAFSHFPIGGTVIWRLNLFAALCCATSVFFYFRVFLALLQTEESASENSRRIVEAKPASIQRWAAAVGALTLAFSTVFWKQSTGIEVYSLNLLTVSLVLFFFVKATRGPEVHARAWQLFAFCLGLSFANHMTTVQLLPGLAVFFFAARGFSRPAWMRILRGLPAFFAGLSLYLFLPLRAASRPLMNWGNPVTFENFWRHLTGKQYSVWMFSSAEAGFRQFEAFAAAFPANFGYVALLPMGIGFVALWANKSGRRVAAFTTVLFAVCVLSAVNYDVNDLETYFLLAHAVAAFWVARGALALLPVFSRARLSPSWAMAGLAAVCVLPLSAHYGAVDESGDYVVEDYARNMFNGLQPGATVVSYQWDYFVAAAYYLQLVEGLRPDVTVLDRELLRRSWYLAQLESTHPGLVAECRAEIDVFLRAVRPFERREPYDGAAIQTAFEAMIRALLAHAGTHGPVYSTLEIEPVYLQGYRGVPAGLAFRLYAGESAPVENLPAFSIRPFPEPRKDGFLLEAVRAAYAAAYVNHAYHQGSLGNIPAVRPLLEKALEIRPGYPQALELMRRMEGGQ
jgi:hypothetical protein